MSHQIKLRRASRATSLCTSAQSHILCNIPDDIVSALTSSQIAELMQAMHTHFLEGMHQEREDLCGFLGLPSGENVYSAIGALQDKSSRLQALDGSADGNL